MNPPVTRPDPMPEKWAAAWDAAEPGSIEQFLIAQAVGLEKIDGGIRVRSIDTDRFTITEDRLIAAQDRADEFLGEGDYAQEDSRWAGVATSKSFAGSELQRPQ